MDRDKNKSENSRRQFLRNTTLAAISASIIPSWAKAETKISQNVSACNHTTLDAYGQGPFYTVNAPNITNNELASSTEPGTRLIISGVVRTINCSLVIPNTEIDIWQANSAAIYDNTGFNLRGKTYSNSQGFYSFETVLPGKYLNGSQYRPRHIHFKITPPTFPTLTTQLYFQGDTDIPADFAASQTSGTYDATHRIIPLTLNGQGKYEGTWDIIINGNGTTAIEDLHSDKGVIYSTSPNPFTDSVEINYGVFKSAKVSVQVFDMNGSLIAILDEQNLSPQKYTAVWNPGDSLAKGIYWISLKVNDLQIHYQKIIKL